MHLPKSWLSCLVSLFDTITFSSIGEHGSLQKPLIGEDASTLGGDGPVFSPPYPGPEPDRPAPDVAIKCRYPSMTGWEECNDKNNRGCWLRQKSTGKEINIETNYEKEENTPNGVTRKYILDVNEMALAPDGVANLHGKVFNGSYPGPWIQACWGDTIEVTVRNHLWYNGTSIHWHGLRQLNSVEMDGVNAVTQCPIAPDKEFTYKFRAMQYGSSWYHSHYSMQYADGLAGPMTIYGPSTANYTEAVEPLLMTDWNHQSAFEDWSRSFLPNTPKGPFVMTNILFNGRGRYSNPNFRRPIGQPQRHTQFFQEGHKYLLRLINTAVDTAFAFSIDGHEMTVIGSDFVPIEPYTTDAVRIGIGQRYHVVVHAKPSPRSAADNYWMRAIPLEDCGYFAGKTVDTQVGVLRYHREDVDDPVSQPHNINTVCADEPYEKLIPKLRWDVGEPANPEAANNEYEVRLKTVSGSPYHPSDSRSRWLANSDPMWLDFDKPTINQLHNPEWPKNWEIVTKDRAADAWIYLVITAKAIKGNKVPGYSYPSVAHPIHLHGHDFALLAQSSQPYPGSLNQVALKRDNPPRRDVVLLPAGGYVVIAFKADNPGAWIIHCHIAWHASSGLAFQILENKDQIMISDEIQAAINQTCDEWNDWWSNATNHWNPTNKAEFQDDSGI